MRVAIAAAFALPILAALSACDKSDQAPPPVSTESPLISKTATPQAISIPKELKCEVDLPYQVEEGTDTIANQLVIKLNRPVTPQIDSTLDNFGACFISSVDEESDSRLIQVEPAKRDALLEALKNQQGVELVSLTAAGEFEDGEAK